MSEENNTTEQTQDIEVKPVQEKKRSKWLLVLDSKYFWVVAGVVAGSVHPAVGVFVRDLGQLVMQVL